MTTDKQPAGDPPSQPAYVEALLNRLRRHYVERTPLPAGAPLTFALLRRLCEHVLCEGYGERERGYGGERERAVGDP